MSDLHACAAKQVVSSPWGAPLLGSPSPFAESHAKDAPRQIPSKFRTSPPDPTAHLALQHYQLVSQRGILCFKSALELEERGGQVQEKDNQRGHRHRR